jgi:hypothetical protein
MPRYRRQVEAGSVQHLVSRFVDRRFSFDEPCAREEYLARVPAALKRADWRVLAYALMSSHVHWVMMAGSRPSSAFIKPLHSGFASWLNRRTGRLGPVFADRHRTIACEGETAGAVIAYVHNNPVRAGVASDAAGTRWTSHRAYLGLEPAPAWLDIELGLALCGFEPNDAGRVRLHDFVRSRAGEPRSAVWSGGGLERRRADARLASASPVELAAPTARLTGDTIRLEAAVIVPRYCPERSPWRGSPLDIVGFVASAVGVDGEQLRSRSRVRAVTALRRLALLLWCNELARPNLEMARALGISASSACGLMARATREEHACADRLALELAAGAPNTNKRTPSPISCRIRAGGTGSCGC